MKKQLLAAFLIAGLATTVNIADATLDGTVPSLNNAINGSVTNTTYGLDVKVNGAKGAVGQFDWNTYNLGSDKTVKTIFTNYSQTALNRVLDSNPSLIYGKLIQASSSATKDYAGTGKVILINPNGIMFGAGSQVNLNSFTASTFDAANAKNIKDLSACQLKTYTSNLANYFGDGINIKFSGTQDKIGALIKADNAKMDVDKTLIMMGKDIEIANGSDIKTNRDYNYGSPKNQSFSNIKISAGNGGTVSYKANGYVYNEDFSANKALSGVESDIKIGSTNTSDGTAIESGNIFIKNAGLTYDKTKEGGTDGSNIVIQNSYILGNKLINNEYGEIDVIGNNYVDVKNSWLKTYNTYEEDNTSKNTNAQEGGNITINAGAGIGIEGSTLQTAYSTQDNVAGNIKLNTDYGNISVNKSDILARGNVDVNAKLNANVTNSYVIASNPQAGLKKNITIKGGNEVNIGNTLLDATLGDVAINSDKNINIYKNANGVEGNRSIIYAGDKVSLIGANTSIADTALSYKNLKLYDTKDNNITIANNSTFEDRDSTTGLALDVKGTLTMNNATLKKAVVTEASKATSVGSTSNQTKIALTATGDITAKNSSNVNSDSDLNITSTGGGFNLFGSKLSSTGDTNINIQKSFTTANIDNNATVNAKNISIKTNGTDTDIILNKTVVDNLAHTGRVKLDAKRNVTLDSTSDLNLKRADLVANTGNVSVTSVNDLGLSDVTVKSKNNTIKSTNGSVNLVDLSTLSNTTAPEATSTSISAKNDVKGNVKTNSTKLYVNANKDVELALTGSNNANAGIEVNGKNVTLNGTDDTLSISRIVANRLNLDSKDKFIAAKTTLTSSDVAGLDQPAENTNPETQIGDATGRAYIEVKEFGGFNLDKTVSSIDEDGNYQGFYTASYKPTTYTDGEGEVYDAYAKHFIDLPGASSKQKFLLVYTKLDGYIDDNPPSVDPDPTYSDPGAINIIKIPTPNEIYGLPEPIMNTLTSTANSIISAAAGITVDSDSKDSNEYIGIIEK